MQTLLRTTSLQMAAADDTVTVRPLLTDALHMRNLTLMKVDGGILAVASIENDAPVNVFTSQMRDRLSNIFATLPMINNFLDDEKHYLTSDIQNNSYQLLRLAANLEDASILESKSYELQTIDLVEFLETLCGNVASVSSARQISIEWSLPQQMVPVKMEPRLMSSAILNILRNSFAYTKDDNHISIRLSRAGKNCLLSIEDAGLGILPENVTHIFDPYFSSDPYGDSNVRPGVGLGLSVAREAITSFGGTIKAESRFGEGTSIFISLPFTDSQPDTLASQPANYMLNKYSPLFIHLCGHCYMPSL